MKKLLLSLALAASTFAGYSQTNTQWVTSPITDLLASSNLIVATYAIADTTTKEWGGGIGIGAKLNEFTVPTIRFDYIKDRVWVPSANLQLQVPINILVRDGVPTIKLTPFTTAGIATSFNNWRNGDNGNPVGIFGLGASLNLPKLAPKLLVLVDYERWTGKPFDDDQVRFGLAWKF
jgi:hypothetical protein